MQKALLVVLLAGMLLSVPVTAQSGCTQLPVISNPAFSQPGLTAARDLRSSDVNLIAGDAEEFEELKAFPLAFQITTEDEDEVVSVSLELIHREFEHSLLVPFSILNKTVTDETDGERATWRHEMHLTRGDLITGTYTIVFRAFDIDGCKASLPAAGSSDALGDFIFEAPETGLTGSKLDPFLAVPGVFDPDNPQDLAAAGGKFQQYNDFSAPIVLKGEDRLPVRLDLPNLTLPWRLTYELRLAGGGLFTEEQSFDPRFGLGPEILSEGTQQVILRYYSRDTDAVPSGVAVDLDNDGLDDFLPPALELHLFNVTVDRSKPFALEPDTGGPVFRGIEFDVSVTAFDETGMTGRIDFVGASLGLQVREGEDDVGAPLTVFRDGAIRYDDRDLVLDPANRPLNSGDVVYYDSDGDRFVSHGDIVLSGEQAGVVVSAAADPEAVGLGRSLIDPVSPPVDAYVDNNGDRMYDPADTVYIDDPGGTGEGIGERSRLDLPMSGGQRGRFVLQQDAGGDLRDGSLGIFGFHDADGDGIFDFTESVYYTGGSQVATGDVRVANPIRGQSAVASSDPGTGFLVFGPFQLEEVGDHRFRLELTDGVGNRLVREHTVTVIEPFTELHLQNVTLLSKTPLAGEPVVVEAQVRQVDGVTSMPVDVVFQALGKQDRASALVPANGTATVDHEDPYRPGRHTMELSVTPAMGAELLNASEVTATLDFEVFLGKVVVPDSEYWIRADDVGLPHQAVLEPGPNETTYDLTQKVIDGAQVQAFDVNGTELFWDPTLRNDTNRAITEFEELPAAPPTDGTDDSPLPVFLVLAAVAVALARRRR